MAHSRHDRRPRALRWLVLPALLLSLGGCTDIDNALASVPIFAFLRESPAFDPYEAPRPAPEGAVPFAAPNGAPALPPVEPNESSLQAFAEEIGSSPIAMTDSTIAAGQEVYNKLCLVCHGPLGTGQGPVVGPEKFPPVVSNLTLSTSVERSDGYLYAVIRAGRGLMPAYGAQTTHRERWLVVNYVRRLQQDDGADASGQDAGQSGDSAEGRN